MKVYSTLFLLLSFLSFFHTSLKSAEESLRLDSPELRIEFLQAEIDRIQAELAELSSLPKTAGSVLHIQEKSDSLNKLRREKGQFELLKAEFSEIETELIELQDKLASSDIQTEEQFDEIFAHRLLAETRKIELMQRLCIFCDDLDQLGPQDLPFFLKGVKFSAENHVLGDETLRRYGCLSHKSLQEITGRSSDENNFIRQLPVALQSMEVGGSGSCAYHSLKNGIVLLHALFCAVDSQQTVMQNLKSRELIKSLFSRAISPWRAIVTIERRKKLIEEFIRNLMLQILSAENNTRRIIGNPGISATSKRPNKEICTAVNFFTDGQWLTFEPFSEVFLKEGFEDRIRLLFLTILERRFVHFVNALPIEADQSAPIEITGEMLALQLLQVIASYGNTYKDLCSVELIKKYFPNIEKLRIIINNKGLEECGLFKFAFDAAVAQHYMYCGALGTSYGLEGEWALKEEFQPILENEKTSGLLRILFDNQAPILTFFMGDAAQDENGGITLEGELVFKDGQTVSYAEGFQEIKDALANPESSCAICIITHLPGHWITLVINKVGPKKQYFVADSTSTSGKTINDASLKLLIRLVEGVDEPVAAPEEDNGGNLMALLDRNHEIADTGNVASSSNSGRTGNSSPKKDSDQKSDEPPAGWGCIIS